jgi:competence protein ComEC
MASALDLIAAVGQTFGERPEAVRALAKPPDIAFIVCVVSLLWACLWRGGLRWCAAPIFVSSLGLYLTAPQPVAAFDADLRAIYARDDGGWTLLAARGRSTYARDRLGAMLGIAPPRIARLAPPEACGESYCIWNGPQRPLILARDAAALERACVRFAIVIAETSASAGYATRCQLAALIDAHSIAERGGAMITETPLGPNIARAWPREVQRPWTPRVRAAEDE